MLQNTANTPLLERRMEEEQASENETSAFIENIPGNKEAT